MTPIQRAKKWLSDHGLRVDYDVDTSHPARKVRAVVRGPWDHCEDYALGELVKAIRGPRREPTLKWEWESRFTAGERAATDGHPGWELGILSLQAPDRFAWFVHSPDVPGFEDTIPASNESRTLAGAKRAAMFAAERAMRLRKVIP